MDETLPNHQQHQNTIKGEHVRFPSAKAIRRSRKRKRQRKRKARNQDGIQNQNEEWYYQNKWSGNEDFAQQRQDMRRGYFPYEENYHAEYRDDYYRYTRETGAQRNTDTYPQLNENSQQNNSEPSCINESRTANVAVEQSPLPRRERSDDAAPKTITLSERNESANTDVTPQNVGNINNVNINIKTEKNKSSSSSSSDSEESSTDNATKRLQNVVNNVPSTNPLKKSNQPNINIKKEKRSSSSSTSSDSTSESDSNMQKVAPAIAIPAKKNSSEEEVICLGKLERKENLVDDEDEDMPLPMEDEKVCFICETPGHVAFQCFTVCRNCNGQYHGFKNCPKPPNISLILQFFIQHCMDQVCKYNPSNKFNLDAYQQINSQLNMESMGNDSMKRKRRNSNDAGSSVSKASHKRRLDSSTEESDSSSDENIKRKTKRRSKPDSDFDVAQQMPYNPALSFAFNPTALGMNHLLALGQMMGYNDPSLRRKKK